MFNPQPKPTKSLRKKKTVKHKNTFLTSDGEKVTQDQIKQRLTASYREKHAGNPEPACEGCGQGKADDNSHIISQRRLKQIGKSELIWDPNAYCSYCRECHTIWESNKSGEWTKLNNAMYALEFLKEHDGETYIKIINCV